MVELELVGRHALLFDDDANAMFVNSEEALVDWNSLLIDRYDVRHLLSGPPPPRNRRRQVVPHADASIATELDRERYLDLASDEQEQDVNEEVLPVADDGYRAIGFSYGYQEELKEPKKDEDVETIYRPPFPVPESLSQNLPPTEKVHQIIARTATFVSNHGGQSEIVLRVKQGDNPKFGFLMPGHNLHPYFRFLVDHQELLKPTGDGKKETPSQTGGALSLLGSIYGYDEEEDGEAVEELPNPKISKSPDNAERAEAISSTVSQGSESSESTSVKNQTVLNNRIKEKVSTIKRNPSINSVKGVAAPVETKTLPLSIAKAELPVVEPPSEMKRVIEKIVEFILRNGKEFESVLAEQDRKFGRFPFLLPTNIYHSYYLQVLQKTQESKLTSKSSVYEEHEPTNPGKEKKTSRREVASPSRGISNGDTHDRKEKFKTTVGKPEKNKEDPPPKVNQQPAPEIVLDAEVTAAILKAATRGIKAPSLEIFSKQNAISEAQSTSEAEAEADSLEASLTKEQRVKAERLKRAKMFAAMIKKKNGAAPLKPDLSRGLSIEPVSSSEEIKRLEKKAVLDECTERRSRRTYRPRSSKEDEDEEEEERDNGRSRKKHRSDRSSKKRHYELSDEDDEEDRNSRYRDDDRRRKRRNDCDRFSGDDDEEERNSRHRDDDRRRKRRNDCDRFSGDDDEEERNSWHRNDDRRRKRRSDYDRFSGDEDRDRGRRSRAEKRREPGSGKEGEVDEGEISAPSKKKTVNETARESSAELLKSPSESVEVPDDLRAKVRAMLMATM